MARPIRPTSPLLSMPSRRRSAAQPSSWHAARDILDETNTHYLIRWEGADPATGAPFEPSWQPKRNANAALVRKWKDRTRKEQARHNQDHTAPSSSPQDGDSHSAREPPDGLGASFPAKTIVAERGSRYRVAWAPDPRTGEEYADTWEPKHYVSRDLVDAWRQQKQERRQQRRLRRTQKKEGKKQLSRAASDEPKTPRAPSDEEGNQERGLAPLPENGPTPDIVVGRSALGNAAASRINANRWPVLPRRARMAKASALLSAEENLSPFWDPTCRPRSGKVIQYGAKKNWLAVLRR